MKYNYVCATLVDRIVPGFPRKEIAEIQQKIGYKDNLVVQAEIFHLWVIEKAENMTCEELRAEFPADQAGLHVLIAESEAPYHERKVTLLNGPHTVLSPVAYLSGINIVRDALHDEVIGKYIKKVQYDELMQTLNLPMDELQQFAADVLERFDNPYVDHQVTSIMLNSFPKFQARDLPGVKVYLERKGELPKGLVLGLAAIITYYKRVAHVLTVLLSSQTTTRRLWICSRNSGLLATLARWLRVYLQLTGSGASTATSTRFLDSPIWLKAS